MRTPKYPSDVTDAQWRLIEGLIPVYPGGRPRTTALRDVVDAIFYVLRTNRVRLADCWGGWMSAGLRGLACSGEGAAPIWLAVVGA